MKKRILRSARANASSWLCWKRVLLLCAKWLCIPPALAQSFLATNMNCVHKKCVPRKENDRGIHRHVYCFFRDLQSFFPFLHYQLRQTAVSFLSANLFFGTHLQNLDCIAQRSAKVFSICRLTAIDEKKPVRSSVSKGNGLVFLQNSWMKNYKAAFVDIKVPRGWPTKRW